MRTAKVILDDGTSYETSINGTDKEILAYFVGQRLNMGTVADDMKTCVGIEIDGEPQKQLWAHREWIDGHAWTPLAEGTASEMEDLRERHKSLSARLFSRTTEYQITDYGKRPNDG